MSKGPLPILVRGYGLASAAGAVLWAAGVSAPVALAAMWLGGAILTLGLAAFAALRAPVREAGAADDHAEDAAALEAALAAWEADRRGDVAAALAARASATRRAEAG